MRTEAKPKPNVQGPDAVTAASILAFAAGVNDSHPERTDPAHAAFRAHPLYCATSLIPATGMVLFRPGIELDVNRIVHGGISLRFGVAVRPGDTLRTVAELEGIEDKSSGRLASIAFRTSNQHDQEVAAGVSRYFARGKGGGAGGGGRGGAGDGATAGPPDYEETVITGDDQSLRYAQGSGDRFPIHTDDEFARSVGLPGMIMHGMCSLALSVDAVLAATAGGDDRRLETVACRFAHIALPGKPQTVRMWRRGPAVSFITLGPDGEIIVADGEVGLTSCPESTLP